MKGEGYKEQRRQHPQQPCQRPAVFGLRGFFLPVAGNARLARLCRRFLKQTSPSFRGRYASPSGDLLRPEPGNHGVRRLGTDLTPWIPAFAGMTTVRCAWGSSLRYGPNPMDPRLAVPRNFVSLRETRFRGDDDAVLKRLRKRHAGLARLCGRLCWCACLQIRGHGPRASWLA